ncbi:MAG TPA: ATP-binding cassette domain-containing protein [Burkholderiaceae bacterium]|nr:ATP-binding cassette domain-containing protein [Burkholderiaceae bacterium]
MIAVERLAKRFHVAAVAKRRPGLSLGLGSRLVGRAAPRVVHAVRDVSFEAPNGRITGLLGPNGAGKTTTLRMLAGLITPDAGRMQVDGIDVASTPRAALARMGMLSDARGLYPRLTARENIVYYGRLQGMTHDAANARAEHLAQMFEMGALLDRRTDGFSQGERMKTALARALVHDPANIVLDEPTNGLDVLATRALRDSLRWLRSPEGGAKCIVFSTHIMQEVERLCDGVVIVSHGRTVARGTAAELLAQTGETDFEEAFVQLAFSVDERAHHEGQVDPSVGDTPRIDEPTT